MIKVYYDYQIFAMQQYGGISRYFYELAQRVNLNPHFDASIVAPLFINQYLKSGRAAVIGVNAPQIPKTGKLIKSINRSFSSGVFFAGKPDLIHCTYYENPPRRNLPQVLTVYDMIHERYPESFVRNDATTRKKKSAITAADHIICISDSTRRDVIDILGVPSNKLTTVYLGFDVGSQSSGRAMQQPESSAPYFLYVGNRDGYKNFSALLHAYASSKVLSQNTRLVAFGGGRFSSDELLLMRRLGLEIDQHVSHRTGSDEELTNCYRNALAFVYPSLYEGFGIPPLEAMNCDCPVLCSNTSSLPEVVGDAARTFDPLSHDEIVVAMESVATSTAERRQLIEAGRLRLKKFSWDRCAAETMQIYREVLA